MGEVYQRLRVGEEERSKEAELFGRPFPLLRA